MKRKQRKSLIRNYDPVSSHMFRLDNFYSRINDSENYWYVSSNSFMFYMWSDVFAKRKTESLNFQNIRVQDMFD